LPSVSVAEACIDMQGIQHRTSALFRELI
jgi:hypothetical protein